MSEERLSPGEIERANRNQDLKSSPSAEKAKAQRVKNMQEDWQANIKPKAEGGN